MLALTFSANPPAWSSTSAPSVVRTRSVSSPRPAMDWTAAYAASDTPTPPGSNTVVSPRLLQ